LVRVAGCDVTNKFLSRVTNKFLSRVINNDWTSLVGRASMPLAARDML
jgi:hypothetical protein